MQSPEPIVDEVEGRLAELHVASFGWACSCCGWNETEAEEVLQTVYVKVLSGRARYDGRSAFRTWLFGVIRNTAREHARAMRSHEKRLERVAVDVDVHPSAGEQPDAVVEREERAERLKSALDELPDRQREVLQLVFYQDLTIKEAADVMQVSIGSARVHYDRGKKRLRKVLEASGTGEGP
jgi:RNA polymerase sigma-70 factor (ECF subfamily)